MSDNIAMNSPQANRMKEVISAMLEKFNYGVDNREVLAEYVTVMIINNKSLDMVNEELGELIGGDFNTSFGSALFQELGREIPGAGSDHAPQNAKTLSSFTEPQHHSNAEVPRSRSPPREPRKTFPVSSARMFSNAMDGAMKDAALSSEQKEMRRFLENGSEDIAEVPPPRVSPVEPRPAYVETTRPARDIPTRPSERNARARQLGGGGINPRHKKAPMLSRLGDRMNPYGRQNNIGNGPPRRPHGMNEGQWNGPGAPPHPGMWNGGFPPFTPEVAMSMGMGMPPFGIPPPGMMGLDPNFNAPFRSVLDRTGPRRSSAGNLEFTQLKPVGGEENIVKERKVRCVHWPNCRKGSSCTYLHPTRVCTAYPNCPNDAKTCNFIHPDAISEEKNTTLPTMTRQNPLVTSKPDWTATGNLSQPTSAPVSTTACKFGSGCTRVGCHFSHPKPAAPSSSVLCRFHPHCTNTACTFEHPGTKETAYGQSLADGDVDMDGTAETTIKPSTLELLDRPLSDTSSKPGFRSQAPVASSFKKSTPCREGAACKRPACYFTHPWDKPTSVNVPCRFAAACTRSDCPYQHARHHNKTTVFNKPGAQPQPHLSDRTFSLGAAEERIIPGQTANGIHLDLEHSTMAGPNAATT